MSISRREEGRGGGGGDVKKKTGASNIVPLVGFCSFALFLRLHFTPLCSKIPKLKCHQSFLLSPSGIRVARSQAICAYNFQLSSLLRLETSILNFRVMAERDIKLCTHLSNYILNPVIFSRFTGTVQHASFWMRRGTAKELPQRTHRQNVWTGGGTLGNFPLIPLKWRRIFL